MKNYRALNKDGSIIRQCADIDSRYVLRVQTKDAKVYKITEDGMKIWTR